MKMKLLGTSYCKSSMPTTQPPCHSFCTVYLSIWPQLFRDAGLEKRRGEQLKWYLAFRLYIGSFPCSQLPGPVHTAWLGQVCFFCIFSLGLYFVLYSFMFLWLVCVSPSFYVSLGSWVISLTVYGVSVTNLNEPPRALATSTISWVRS